jgi:DNA-binding PucR family transcriptional regulator
VNESSLSNGDMPELVRGLSSEFLARGDVLAEGMSEHLHRQIPELGGFDDELLRETRASCASNITQSFRLLRSGAPASDMMFTPEAREYVRGFVNRNINVPVLLRTYRLGHAWIWESWTDALRERAGDPNELAAAIEFSSRWMFAYIDLVSAAVVENFAVEQARRMRGAEQLRAAAVRAIFADEIVDDEVASRRLGYELRRAHLALHVWSESGEAAGLERTAGEAAELLGAGTPLIIASGSAALDVWYGFSDRPGDEACERIAGYQPPEGICVAIGGGYATGLAGFRVARDEARQAARVRVLAGARLGSVTNYADVELVTLLTGDIERARRFVKHRLGDLAANDDPTRRLRATVLAFLRCNRSSGQAARELFVHQNTVTYRIHRAEEVLGRPVTDDQAELLCALILAEVIGPDA